jgi:hypothetical protein
VRHDFRFLAQVAASSEKTQKLLIYLNYKTCFGSNKTCFGSNKTKS